MRASSILLCIALVLLAGVACLAQDPIEEILASVPERVPAQENALRWDLTVTMPTACRIEVAGTVSATGHLALDWSEVFVDVAGHAWDEVFRSIWPGELTSEIPETSRQREEWVDSLHVESLEIGDPFVAEIAYTRDVKALGCLVDLAHFPGILAGGPNWLQAPPEMCGSTASFNIYPAIWSSDITIVAPVGEELEVPRSRTITLGDSRYVTSNGSDGGEAHLRREAIFAGEADPASCADALTLFWEVLLDEADHWFRVLP